MSADSPRRATRGVPAIVPPQVVSDRSIIDNVAGFINDVALTNQPQSDPKDTIAWARFEQSADISDPTFGDDWEIDGNISPPLLLILGYGLGVQVWAIPANGEAIEVLSWRHGHVTTLRVLPTPFSSDDEMADEPIDNYVDKRPLMAICDGSTTNTGSAQTCYSVNFVSLKTGAQVKTIKFKYAVLDVLANRTSVVVTFPERIAVFDARTLEDRLSVTTCYPSPGINPNPVALGPRWMAYAENKILHSKRSGGGCDGDGVSSYTATVLNAAKSFGKGLREFGEQMAAGLTGSSSGGIGSKSGSFDSGTTDMRQVGVVTILDIKNPINDISPTTGAPISINGSDPMIAHFIAHSEAIVAMEFDFSGMLLITADRRGHNFHVFRIQPHPAGSHLAAVQHLYILHRGDTSAKVQNITFALDSRWVAVSTLRGTTHVFPVTPYGGTYGVRTHSSLHVVNKLSRFHRSAGLSGDNRSNSPISHSESMTFNQICMPYHNPTMPPFPRPHTILPLAQLRQPSVLGSPPGSAQNLSYQKSIGGGSSNRQRLSSLSDDSGKPLSVCSVFAKGRSWLLDPPNVAREGPAHKLQRKAVDSLFIMAGHGALIQYDLDTKLASNIAKEKICDDTPIELEVEAKAQWNLGRRDNILEIQPPLSSDNWLVKDRHYSIGFDTQYDDCDDRSERWLSQVEIITHAGPHRRLWMGPQFVFKTYNTPSGSSLSHIESEAIEIGVAANANKPGRSSPMNMPLGNTARSAVPVLIESGSYSSIEQSPKLMDRFKHEHLDSDFTVNQGESRLKEDLADAMRESPSVQHKDTGLTPTTSFSPVNPVTTSRKSRDNSNGAHYSNNTSTTSMSSTENNSSCGTNTTQIRKPSSNLSSSMNSSSLTIPEEDDFENTAESGSACTYIETIVNPLGTVTTIQRTSSDKDSEKIAYDPADHIILENCDESLFRPVVTIFCDEKNKTPKDGVKNSNFSKDYVKNLNDDNSDIRIDDSAYFKQPPEAIGTKLVVPVIEKSIRIESISNNDSSNRNKTKQSADNDVKIKCDIENLEGEFDKFTNELGNTYNINKEKNVMVVSNENQSNIDVPKKTSNDKSIELKTYEKNIEKTINNSKYNDKYSRRTAQQDAKNSSNQKIVKKEQEELKNKNNKMIESNLKCEEQKELEICDMTNKTVKKNYDEISMKTNKSKQQPEDEIFIEIKDLIDPKQNLKKNTDETKVIPQRKSSKDDDSESFESLENIEEASESKQRQASDNFDSAEDCHHESDIVSTYVTSKWEHEDNIKYEKSKISNEEDTSNKAMNESSSNSVEVTITLPKKGKNNQNKQKSKQTTNDKIATSRITIKKVDTKLQPSELEFVDKFVKDRDEVDDVQVHVDFQTLQDSLHEEQLSITTDTEIKTIKPIVESPTKNKKTSNKTKENSTKNLDNEDMQNIDEIKITLPLNNNKKKQKTKIVLQETSNINLSSKQVTDDIKNNLTTVKDEKIITNIITDPPISIKNAKFIKKDLNFPALPTFDSLSSDFKETFLPSLSPLEPFESKFDDFQIDTCKKKTDEHQSLINFESPESPNKSIKKQSPITSIEPKPRGFSEDTLIFALCGSLHYENENNNDKIKTSKDLNKEKLETSILTTSSQPEVMIDNDFSNNTTSTKRKNRKKDKTIQKTILTQDVPVSAITSSSTSSSEETEESSLSASSNKRRKSMLGDDEELRPLIDVSMTQSISCGNGSSLSEISSIITSQKSIAAKKLNKKQKTMSEILKGEVDNTNIELDVDINVDAGDKNDKKFTTDQDLDSKTKKGDWITDKNTVKLPKSKKTLLTATTTTTLPDFSNQSDSSTTSDPVKTSEEQASSESSDEQLIQTKKLLSKSNRKLSTTTITNTTDTIGTNDDSSESETKPSPPTIQLVGINSSSGNDSGSGGSGGGGNSTNITANLNNNNNNYNINNNNNGSSNSNQNDCTDGSNFTSATVIDSGGGNGHEIGRGFYGGGSQSTSINIDMNEEFMSSSSVSSASRVSLDQQSSSPPNSGENFLHFPDDSSGSL